MITLTSNLLKGLYLCQIAIVMIGSITTLLCTLKDARHVKEQ